MGQDPLTDEAGRVEQPGPRSARWIPFRPAPLEVFAGTLSGLIVTGVIGAVLGLTYVGGMPAGPTPEPDPAGLMAFLVGLIALAGLIASVGGAFRGALGGLFGCVLAPLAIILALALPGLVAGEWPSFGWFFWWPCAIILAVPFAIVVGIVSSAGAESFRRARSQRRALAWRLAAVIVIHALTWALLTGLQWLKDHPADPPVAARAPRLEAERFPGKMELGPVRPEPGGKPQ
jgi:hypothetical protein